jgi:uncharacterized Tic20 family protein
MCNNSITCILILIITTVIICIVTFALIARSASLGSPTGKTMAAIFAIATAAVGTSMAAIKATEQERWRMWGV